MKRVFGMLEGLVAPNHEDPPEAPTKLRWLGLAAVVVGGAAEVLAGLVMPVATMTLTVVVGVAFLFAHARPAFALALLSVSVGAQGLSAAIGDAAFETTFAGGIAVPFTMYTISRHAPARIVGYCLAFGLVLSPVMELLVPSEDSAVVWAVVGFMASAALIGVALAVRATAATKFQAEETERAQERNRLANDIHDSVAHHMSAIAIRAESAIATADPRSAEALRTIKHSASTALADVRHLINEIRYESADARPLPGLGDIRQLAAEASDANLKVRASIDADAEVIPVSVSATAFAICREAVTNTRRHATNATEAHITIRHTGSHLALSIADDGATPLTQRRNGHGLRSMTERAKVLSGSLTAGPSPTGGWLVAAQLPTTAAET